MSKINKFLKKYRNNKKIKYFTIGILFIIIVVLFTEVKMEQETEKEQKNWKRQQKMKL